MIFQNVNIMPIKSFASHLVHGVHFEKPVAIAFKKQYCFKDPWFHVLSKTQQGLGKDVVYKRPDDVDQIRTYRPI